MSQELSEREDQLSSKLSKLEYTEAVFEKLNKKILQQETEFKARLQR